MKPARFDYVRPASVEAVLSVLSERTDDARILAGGQSLMPMLNLRLAQAGLLIDINHIPELNALVAEEGGLRVGATVRHADLLAHVLGSNEFPLLASAMPFIAHPAIRNRGTVCGSLAMADPASELPACALCLNAEIIAASVRGRRIIPASEFFLGLYETALTPDEMIVEVFFPRAETGWRFAFEEVARRHGDFALAGLGSGVQIAEGVIRNARLVFFGVADRPVRAEVAEGELIGQSPADPAVRKRAIKTLSELEVTASGEYPAEYKRHLAGILLERTLAKQAGNPA